MATTQNNHENNQVTISHREDNPIMDRPSAPKKYSEYFTNAVHLLIIGFVLFIFYLCFTQKLTLFTWHPILLSCGWILLLAEGILMLAPNNILSKKLSLLHKSKVRYHWIIQTVGVGYSAIGFIVIYVNKNLNNKTHFHSWHGLMGLISVICCIPACITGIIALYNNTFKGYLKPANGKLIHRICGILTFLIGGVTVLLSLTTKWFERYVHESIAILWLTFIIIIVISTVLPASIKIFNRFKCIL